MINISKLQGGLVMADTVFLSYSHVDEKFKEKLDIHFAPLKKVRK